MQNDCFNQWDRLDSQPLGIEEIEATSEGARWLSKWEDNLRSTDRTILEVNEVIRIFFLLPKYPFGWTIFKNNIQKFQRVSGLAKNRKV